MAFTYVGPAACDRDLLRFTVGDTAGLRHLLEDDEIAYLISTEGSVDRAVIPAVDAMIAKASTSVDWSSGQERESASQRVAALRRLRADLLTQGFPELVTTVAASRVRILARPPADATDFTARTTSD